MRTMTSKDIDNLVNNAVQGYLIVHNGPPNAIWGIPRGGVAVAYKVAHEFQKRRPDLPDIPVFRSSTNDLVPHGGVLVVDDIVDSGQTMRPFIEAGMETMALVVNITCPTELQPTFRGADNLTPGYITFPWDEKSSTPEDCVVRLLEFLGLNPNDPSIKETPRRFLAWLAEFKVDQPEPDITTFDGVTYDQMVLVRKIPFLSLCEHHLLPFRGIASVAYIPQEGGQVIGLSKLARIVMHRAKRPHVQERLSNEILDAVVKATGSPHVAVVMDAEHECMSLRGPKALGSSTITSALSGDFKEDPKTREEFLRLSGY